MFPLVRKPLHFSFSTVTTKISFLWCVIRFLGLSTVASPIYKFGGKSVGWRFLFVTISTIDSIALGLSAAVLSTKLLQKKKKKKNYKKNFFKGTLLKAGRAKIELASCVLVCGTCLHMTGTWKYHTSCWQLTVHVSRGFCCGFLLLPHNQQAKGNSRRKWAAREATAHPKHCLQHTEVSWPSSTQVPAHMAGTTKCHTHTSVRPLFQEINFWGIHSLFSVHWHLCISRSTAKHSQHPASQPAATDSEERPWMSKPLFVLHSGLVPWKLGAGQKSEGRQKQSEKLCISSSQPYAYLPLLLSFISTASPNSTQSSSNTPAYASFSSPTSPREQLTVGGFVAIGLSRDCLAEHCGFSTTRFRLLFKLFLPHLPTPPSER